MRTRGESGRWYAATAAIVLIVCAALSGEMSQSPAAPLASLLSDARTLVDEGRAAEAVAKLRAAGASGDPRVQQLLGVALYHADDYAAAIEALRAALPGLTPQSVEHREAEQVLGLSLFLAGRIADAIPFLERTREVAPRNLELQHVLGQAYVQTNQPDQARRAFAATFGVAPDSAAAHVLTAQMMIRLELEEAAQAELRKAIEKDPRVPRAHYLLAQQALFRSRLDDALALSRKEIEINPSDAMAFYQLGDALGRQSKWDDSIEALQQSLWLNPFYSGPYILLGRAYTRKNQPAIAEGMLRQAIQYDPNNRTAHYLLAQLLQQLGRTDEAKKEFEIAEKLPGVR